MNERAYQLQEPHLAPVSPLRPRAGPHAAFDDDEEEEGSGPSSSSSFRPEVRARLIGELERWGVTGAEAVVDRFPIETAVVTGRLNEMAVAGQLPKLYSPGGYVMRCIWREAGVDRAPRSVLPEVLAEQERRVLARDEPRRAVSGAELEAYRESMERRRALG